MYKYFDKILQLFLRYRKSVGLSYFIFGSPITLFLREYVGLAPGSTAFTGALTYGSLLLTLPFFTPNRLHMPNIKGSLLLFTYWAVTFAYLLTYAPNRGWFTNTITETIYFFTTLIVFLIALTISINEVKDTFLQATLVICFIACFTIVVVLINDPMFLIKSGGRASLTVTSADGDESKTSGNPHLLAKAALGGLISLALLGSKYKSLVSKIVILGLAVYFIAILGLSQSLQTFIALAIMFVIYALYNLKPVNIYHAARWIFGVRGIILAAILAYSFNYVMNHTKYGNTITQISIYLWGRIEKILFTISGQQAKQISEIDLSAGGRVQIIKTAYKYFQENIREGNWGQILFGNGFQHLYIDSPILQSINDLGFFGFFIFIALHTMLIFIMFKEFRNPQNDFRLFLCYLALLVLVGQVLAGMPYDYTRYSLMAIIFRFCVPYVKIYKTNY